MKSNYILKVDVYSLKDKDFKERWGLILCLSYFEIMQIDFQINKKNIRNEQDRFYALTVFHYAIVQL